MAGGGHADLYEETMQDGAQCLAFLLRAPVQGAEAQIGDGSVGAALRTSGFGHPAQRPLRAMGIVVRPAASSCFVAVAAAHPALHRVFDDSAWCSGWAGALLSLPGACGGERMSFGRVYAPAVLVPRALIEGAAP
jgi:hypothetical protein